MTTSQLAARCAEPLPRHCLPHLLVGCGRNQETMISRPGVLAKNDHKAATIQLKERVAAESATVKRVSARQALLEEDPTGAESSCARRRGSELFARRSDAAVGEDHADARTAEEGHRELAKAN